MGINTFSTALSGLSTNTQGLNVVGNNLANMNTVGFKSTSINFTDVLGQTVSSSGGTSGQVGLGVRSAASVRILSKVDWKPPTTRPTWQSRETDSLLSTTGRATSIRVRATFQSMPTGNWLPLRDTRFKVGCAIHQQGSLTRRRVWPTYGFQSPREAPIRPPILNWPLIWTLPRSSGLSSR